MTEIDMEIEREDLIEVQRRIIKDLERTLDRQDRALQTYRERFYKIEMLLKEIKAEL